MRPADGGSLLIEVTFTIEKKNGAVSGIFAVLTDRIN